jgi:hypothetical protein
MFRFITIYFLEDYGLNQQENNKIKFMNNDPIDLFAPLVPEDKLHPQFKALRDSKFHIKARQFINNIYNKMGDPNGNFMFKFQSEGFHARLFEIACYAYLNSIGAVCNRSFEKPDFMASIGNKTIAIEAVTANPTKGQSLDISLTQLKYIPFKKMEKKCIDDFSIRMANILEKKIRKKYWKLKHCKGKPLVFIVSPFFEPGSMYYVDMNLATYLYGLVDEHEYNGRKITSGFFNKKNSEYVSAVVYCNQFTVPRFYRLSFSPQDISPISAAKREGYYLTTGSNFINLEKYEHDLKDPKSPIETWWQGVTIFINPKANVPLPDGFLKSTSTFRVGNDGLLNQIIHDFHALTSFMFVAT